MSVPSGPVGESILAHYEDPAYEDVVGDRFAVYDRAQPRVDIHERQVQVLGTLGMLAAVEGRPRVLCDVGSGKGDLYPRLVREGFEGLYIALDLSMRQLRLHADSSGFTAPNTLFVNANADQLPIQDDSVDVAVDNFKLYHQTQQEREKTYLELARVVRTGGIIGLSTSSILNKSTQRQGERMVGLTLGVAPPPEMNTNWTSEIADGELAVNFSDWHRYDFVQTGYFVIATEEDVEVSINSIRTARKQYSPVPDESAFQQALDEYREDLMQRIADGHPAIDNIGRTFYLLSRQELPLPKRTLLQ